MGRRASKNTTSDHLQLNIFRLERKCLLVPRGWTVLQWSSRGQVCATIQLAVEFDRIQLRYNHTPWNGDSTSLEYPVFLDSTPCNYGGERRWFLCPGSGCSRRVASLYCSKYFVCRHCLNLSYESQREQSWDRALTRAQAIRERLGGTPCIADDFPEKPKRMRWETYRRLCEEYEFAAGSCWPPSLLRMIRP